MADDGKTIILILGGLAVLGFVFLRIGLPGIRAYALQGGEPRGGIVKLLLVAVVAVVGLYYYRYR
jgi:uncharacterized membrane-anchored protein